MAQDEQKTPPIPTFILLSVIAGALLILIFLIIKTILQTMKNVRRQRLVFPAKM